MDVRNWGAAEWGAFGEVGALVVASIAGVLVWQQVRHGRQVREDQTRPYVIVDFEFQGWEVVVAIRNVGTSPAFDVRMKFDKPLESPGRLDPEELAVFTEGIPMLAPGRSIAIPLGSGPQFFSADGEGVPLRYSATVTYRGPNNKRSYDDPPLVLDLMPYKHTLVERDDLHQIHQNLKEIKTLMKSWTSERRLRINTITQAEVDAQHRAWIEEREAARKAREGAAQAEAETSDEESS